MSTIHLLYSSLKNAFDSHTNGDDEDSKLVILIKRIKKIKQLLNDCNSLPTVINDIIYAYTGSQIKLYCYVTMENYSRWKFSYNNNKDLICMITLYFQYDDTDVKITIEYNIGKIYYNIVLINHSEDLLKEYNYKQSYNGVNGVNIISEINTFMKKFYNKHNYINCSTKLHNNSLYKCVIIKNSIICMSEDDECLNGFIIKNYSKFAHFIVTLKCIIDGIQKYFMETNIKEYCEDKLQKKN